MSTLSGGVFAAAHQRDDDAELRDLVDELGQRSYDRALGQRVVPNHLDAELWHNLQETGLARLSSAPGSEAGPRELAVALYGLARHAAAVPLAETDALAGWLAQCHDLDLPDGPLTVAIADAHLEGRRIKGTAQAVPWARACTTVLAARDRDRLLVGVLDPATTTVHHAHNLAGEPRDAMNFDVPADSLHIAVASTAAELQTRGAWSRCVQIIGVLDAAARLTVEHTRGRQQFGRPLSAFQSVQQSLAEMAGEIERARAAVELAVAAAEEHGFGSPHTDCAVTVAKIVVGRAVAPVTTTAHQLHGAIGVTREHPLWLFTLRAQSWVNEFGTTNEFARRLGHRALDAEDPWEMVTG
ncbi:MAG: acyl-CoA dehydrogenase family protein [Mycobacterium sp.]